MAEEADQIAEKVNGISQHLETPSLERTSTSAGTNDTNNMSQNLPVSRQKKNSTVAALVIHHSKNISENLEFPIGARNSTQVDITNDRIKGILWTAKPLKQ